MRFHIYISICVSVCIYMYMHIFIHMCVYIDSHVNINNSTKVKNHIFKEYFNSMRKINNKFLSGRKKSRVGKPA